MHTAYPVPPITERKRIPQAAIDDLIAQIVAEYAPQRVVLFGSYAHGNPRPDSDVDLLVVMDIPAGRTNLQQAAIMQRSLQYRFGLDLLVYTPAQLQQRLDLGDAFFTRIIEQGESLYESTRT